MEVAGSSQTMLHVYRLTVAGARWWATNHHHLENLRSLYDTQQVLEISTKIWL